MFTIKIIGEESSKLLSSLSKETFLQAYENVHTPENLATYCKDYYSVEVTRKLLGLSNIQAIVAYQDNSAAGFYVIKHHECPIKLEGQSTELKQIYVLSYYFGSGLGHSLFSHLVSAARNNGSEWLWLCVSDVNYRAQTFYEKLGFNKIGKGPILIVGSDKLTSSILSLRIVE